MKGKNKEILRIENLKTYYDISSGTVKAVDDVLGKPFDLIQIEFFVIDEGFCFLGKMGKNIRPIEAIAFA